MNSPIFRSPWTAWPHSLVNISLNLNWSTIYLWRATGASEHFVEHCAILNMYSILFLRHTLYTLHQRPVYVIKSLMQDLNEYEPSKSSLMRPIVYYITQKMPCQVIIIVLITIWFSLQKKTIAKFVSIKCLRYHTYAGD